MNVQLRASRPEDLDRVVEIENLCFVEAKRFDREYLNACMTSSLFLIAEIEGTVAGFAICSVRTAQEAHIDTLNVHPNFRRQHVGAKLLSAMEDFFLQYALDKMSLHVAVSNAGAIELYRRSGYVVSTRKATFYKDGTDAFEMSKPLGMVTSDSSTSHNTRA
jgi:ribosomal-protein-alanine N-acetyltransferase